MHALLKAIKEKEFLLLWSFMLEFENSLNPYEDVRMEIDMASSLASEHVHMADDILKRAKDFEVTGIKSRDAIHLACALKGKANYFLTCDDKLIKKDGFMENKILIMNPVDFVRQEVK